MREGGRVLRAVERLRLALLAVGTGIAAIVMVGGLTGKSTAWTGFEDGGGQSWTDGGNDGRDRPRGIGGDDRGCDGDAASGAEPERLRLAS